WSLRVMSPHAADSASKADGTAPAVPATVCPRSTNAIPALVPDATVHCCRAKFSTCSGDHAPLIWMDPGSVPPPPSVHTSRYNISLECHGGRFGLNELDRVSVGMAWPSEVRLTTMTRSSNVPSHARDWLTPVLLRIHCSTSPR